MSTLPPPLPSDQEMLEVLSLIPLELREMSLGKSLMSPLNQKQGEVWEQAVLRECKEEYKIRRFFNDLGHLINENVEMMKPHSELSKKFWPVLERINSHFDGNNLPEPKQSTPPSPPPPPPSLTPSTADPTSMKSIIASSFKNNLSKRREHFRKVFWPIRSGSSPLFDVEPPPLIDVGIAARQIAQLIQDDLQHEPLDRKKMVEKITGELNILTFKGDELPAHLLDQLPLREGARSIRAGIENYIGKPVVQYEKESWGEAVIRTCHEEKKGSALGRIKEEILRSHFGWKPLTARETKRVAENITDNLIHSKREMDAPAYNIPPREKLSLVEISAGMVERALTSLLSPDHNHGKAH